jgi:predicted NBD/HSP70 family sugar kinase
MAERGSGSHGLAAHGASELTSVIIDTYNAELRDKDGFIGDRASRRAFRAILEDWRERLRKTGEDPIGDADSEEISKKKLDAMITEGNPEAGGLVLSAVEEFAQELTTVIRRFMRLKDWKNTQRIVIGGGLRESRIGELAIGRASVILKAEDHDLELVPIRHDPDDAGLIGCIHLTPPWIFAGHDGILAVDIGGTNIRAGLVGANAKKDPTFAKSAVAASVLWRHADDEPNREEAVERLTEMLQGLIKRAEKDGMRLAPFIGIGCPGLIRADGSIEKGGQNLPGNWEHKRFNLPNLLREALPKIDGHEVSVLMHNDAVVQGLSEVPFMQDVEHWGVMTIGTGLGNARFTNRAPG